MPAIQDRFTPELRDRLRNAVMGLGLVRLLLDANRPREARAALTRLEAGSSSPKKAARPRGKRRRGKSARYAAAC